MTDIAKLELTEVGELQAGDALRHPLDELILHRAQLQLSVEIASVVMTLAELKALHSQSVLPLGVSVDQTFALKWESVVIARGQLVAVGDQLGLELTEICQNEQ